MSAEERLARRAMMHGACAEERLSLSRRRVAELEEALSAASRGRAAAESAASASAATAETESRRADAAARRARVAEADAAAAKQAAAAAAEELEDRPRGRTPSAISRRISSRRFSPASSPPRETRGGNPQTPRDSWG